MDNPRRQSDTLSPQPDEVTEATNTDLVLAIRVPVLQPSGLDLRGTQEFPLITAGVQWTVKLHPQRSRSFESLNAALAYLDEKIQAGDPKVTSDAIIQNFDNLRTQYAQQVKLQKEFGGSLLFEFAKRSHVRHQYSKDQALSDGTKAFWIEAGRDRNKVTRHLDGLRRLEDNQWSCPGFVEGYVMKSMNTKVVETNVYEQHLARARKWGLPIRKVMRRAEQRRWMRIQEAPTTSKIEITVRDINLAVSDLVQDEDAADNPDERVTNAGLQRLTETLRRAAHDRVPKDLKVWGYVDEIRQIFVPPGTNASDDLREIRQYYDLQIAFEVEHPITTAPPRVTKGRSTTNVGKEGFARDGKPLPKRKGAKKRKRQAAPKDPKTPLDDHTEHSPVLSDLPASNNNNGQEVDAGEEDEIPASPSVGADTGGEEEHEPVSKRVKTRRVDEVENDLSVIMENLSLKVTQSKHHPERRKAKLVDPDQVPFPLSIKRSPLQVAWFNEAVNNALEYSGLGERKQPMSSEDIQAFTNGLDLTNVRALSAEIEQLFEGLASSDLSNQLVTVILGQKYSLLKATWEMYGVEQFARQGLQYFSDMWENTYGSEIHTSVQVGAAEAEDPRHAALTLADMRSLTGLGADPAGWLTDRVIVAALRVSTPNLYVPDLAAVNRWTSGRTDNPPTDPEARRYDRVALVIKLQQNHRVAVTINTNTREWNILDSAMYLDRDGSRHERIVELLTRYLMAQFEDWFTDDDQPAPRSGTVRSQQQCNRADCGIYVIENLFAFDRGEGSADEVITASVRLWLAEQFTALAQKRNPDIPQKAPAQGWTSDADMPQSTTFDQMVRLRPKGPLYEGRVSNRLVSPVRMPVDDLYTEEARDPLASVPTAPGSAKIQSVADAGKVAQETQQKQAHNDAALKKPSRDVKKRGGRKK